MSLLDKQLSNVAFRFRQLAWWRSSAIWCAVLGLTGLALLWLQVTARWMHEHSGWWLLGAGIVGLLCIGGVMWNRYRDQAWIANRIESHYPELDQRLITTLAEVHRNQGRPLGYLQDTVFQETMTHSYHNPWRHVVSGQIMSLFRSRSLAAFALMMASAIGLMKWQPPASAFISRTELDEEKQAVLPADFDIQVEPGDYELERGTNLVVLARFGKHIPKEAHVVASDGSTELRVPMSRSLDDPLFGGTISDVQTDLEYHVAYGRHKSATFRVTTYTLPGLVRSDALLEYPSYTQMPEKRIEDTRRVSTVEGSRVTWAIHVNKPGIAAELVPVDGGDAIPLQLDATDGLNHLASLELHGTASWTLKLTDQDGRENRNPPRLTARVTPNRMPNLKLDLARDARVSPLEEFQVKAIVSDDFGLSQYGLNYTLASGSPMDVILGQDAPRRERQNAEYLLDFESLGAEPDQLLSYYFWAEDRDARGDVRRTQSDMYFAEVRHFEEIFRQGQQQPRNQQQQQQQGQQAPNAQTAEQLAELQKQIINATWKVIRREIGDEVSAEFEQDVSLLIESQQAGSEQLQQLAQNIRDNESQQYVMDVQSHMQTSLKQLTSAYSDRDAAPLSPALTAQRAAYQSLLRLRAREHEVVQNQPQQGSQSGSRGAGQNRFQQQLQQLQLRNDENRYETERQAEAQQDQEQTELRQALSRVRELAQRQEDLNRQLRELQNALEQAETEEEREEIERQLKRLRDQQQEMLRDTDELMERLDQSQNQETLQQTREQLEQTREQLRDSSESLQQGEVTPALASGTRAQRELEEMREELRRESANQFSEQMREMRDEARQLEARQEEIGQQMEQLTDTGQRGTGLRDQQTSSDDELGEALQQQQQKLNELLQQIEETVLEAEESEPLLADKLYDAFREIEDNDVLNNLEQAERLVDRGLNEPAQHLENQAREGISNLRQHIDRAAQSVLGDETEALRTAVRMLEDIERQLDQEIEQFDPSSQGRDQPGDRDQAGNQTQRPEGDAVTEPQNDRSAQSDGQRERQASEDSETPQDGERRGQGRPPEDAQPQPTSNQQESPSSNQNQPRDAQQPSQSSGGQPSSQQPPQDSQRQSQSSQPESEQPQQQDGSNGQQPNDGQRSPGIRPSRDDAARDGGGWGGWDRLDLAPITGDDFREWSDRLRDVGEIVDDPELRAEAARIRERARSFRREFKRHSEQPKWDLIREMVAQPLSELRQEVSEELLRRSAAKNALVPIDRDPVPNQYTEQVSRYLENIGRGE